MATSRPSSRNFGEKPSSRSQSDFKRNSEIQNSSEKQKKRSTSSRQSQNGDLTTSLESQKSQSHESQGCKSEGEKSQRHHTPSSQKSGGCLEILTSEGSFGDGTLQHSNRPTSVHGAKKAPSINRINSAPRRTLTPTKQIVLEAARRKQEPTLTYEETSLIMRQSEAAKEDRVKEPGQRLPKNSLRTKEEEKKGDDDDDDGDEEEEEEEEESSSEEEPIKAPNELMMEFLDCVLKADYVNGLKLCTMILLYEPENADALSFRSLIEEKMAIDISNQDDEEEADDDEDDDDDEEDDEDDDEDDSSEDDSDSSESSDDEDEDDEEEEEAEMKKERTKATTSHKTIFVP